MDINFIGYIINIWINLPGPQMFRIRMKLQSMLEEQLTYRPLSGRIVEDRG